MAYRRPGVTVIQEFVGLVPALAAFALTSVSVGPAYQLVDDDALGTYSGAQQTYAYASLLGGALVDLEETASDEQFTATKKEVSVVLRDPVLQILAEQTTGSGDGTAFTDATGSQFADVLKGDIVVITPALGVEIVAPRTDGVTSNTSGELNRLAEGTSGVHDNAKIGDTVTVTGGANTNTGTFTVIAKTTTGTLVLDAAVNDGVGPATDVAYSVTGSRGVANEGEYRISSKTDDNTLVLESPLAEAETPITYTIKREYQDVALDRVATTAENGFVSEESGITIPAGLQVSVGGDLFDVLEANVESSYRALRTDLSANIREFASTNDLNSIFGIGQIAPTNPLAYAVSLMLQNTVTPVYGLGLDSNGISDEVLAYTAATDVLQTEDMYAIALLTQNPVVHTLFANHVTQLSAPDKKLERVVLFNSKLPTLSVLQEEDTTVTTANNSRVIVNTQVDGAAVFATAPETLTDATPDQFLNVQPGDQVVIVGGTSATPGTYTVDSKTDNNTIVLDSAFVTAGSPTDIQYYIYRPDGLDASGLVFYDRNASFISNGVAAGHYLTITSGALAGRYAIATVDSEKQVTLGAAIPGVVSVESAITYQIDRDLSKTEQAEAVAGYSRSFANRRAVHCWPDVVKAPVGQVTEDLPGFYLCPVVAALTSGLPTQQGLTNLSVSGFLGFDHSTRYFREDQLDIIADGGTMIFAQDTPETPLYVRHQLTTDRSAIKFQEYSVTKNVDFIAKFLRTTYRPFIGQYNIVDSTLDALKTTADASIIFLRDTSRIPKFGGVVRRGTLASIAESETQIDTVVMRFQFGLPIPLNQIDITIEV